MRSELRIGAGYPTRTAGLIRCHPSDSAPAAVRLHKAGARLIKGASLCISAREFLDESDIPLGHLLKHGGQMHEDLE